VRGPRKLDFHLLEMIAVQMAIAARPHEVADVEVALLRDEMREERVGGDVERHAQKDVAASLIQLARQLSVVHVELEERVARRQRHPRDVGDVPGRDDETA
jgi:hypothetical protein